jgi:hypothetical protein
MAPEATRGGTLKRVIPILLAAALGSLVTAAAIVLPAAAGDDDPAAPRALPGFLDPDEVDRLRADWADCMSDRGFDLGDDTNVQVTPDGVIVDGKQVDAEKFRAAAKACGGPPGFGVLGLGAGLPDDLFERSRERIREWEACMKEQGFDVAGDTEIRVTPDGVTIDGKPVDAEKFRAAERECGPLFRGPFGRRPLPDLDGLPGLGELERCFGKGGEDEPAPEEKGETT